MPATSATKMMTMGSAPSPRRNERFDIFMSEDESGCLDYFSVANESCVLLHAGVSAKVISRIHFELNEVTGELPVFPRHFGRFWRITPDHLGARKILELIGQPIENHALVVLRIRPIDRGIANAWGRGRRRFGGDN